MNDVQKSTRVPAKEARFYHSTKDRVPAYTTAPKGQAAAERRAHRAKAVDLREIRLDLDDLVVPTLTSKQLNRARQIDNILSRHLESAAQEYRETHRLLLLGAVESGKSTIMKNMRILNPAIGITAEEWQLAKQVIHANIRLSICTVVLSMDSLVPPVLLGDIRNKPSAAYMRSIHDDAQFEYPEEFFGHAAKLWADQGVQVSFARSHEYYLMDCAKYFLDDIERISQPGYWPTQHDLLMSNSRTTSVDEIRISLDGVKLHVFDVGAHRGGREWILQALADVTALFFVVDCGSYNRRSCRGKVNLLQHALDLFREVRRNQWLRDLPVVLVLNKEDLLQEKITSGYHPLERYFPEFAEYGENPQNFRTSARLDWADPNLDRVNKAKDFIRDKLLRISRAHDYDNKHLCYTHFATAIRTEDVKQVLDASRNTIRSLHYRFYDLI